MSKLMPIQEAANQSSGGFPPPPLPSGGVVHRIAVGVIAVRVRRAQRDGRVRLVQSPIRAVGALRPVTQARPRLYGQVAVLLSSLVDSLHVVMERSIQDVKVLAPDENHLTRTFSQTKSAL